MRRKGKDCDLSEEVVTEGMKGEKKQGELNLNDNRWKLGNKRGSVLTERTKDWIKTSRRLALFFILELLFFFF